MSERTPAQDAVARMLGPLDGARIPGGCEHCDAYQTVGPVSTGVWAITVHHDDWCPRISNRAQRRAKRKRREE